MSLRKVSDDRTSHEASDGERHNPKLAPSPPDNAQKDPDDWVSGDDPMTGAQMSYLKTLAEQLADPDAFDEALTKAEASKRIDALKTRLEREGARGRERLPRT